MSTTAGLLAPSVASRRLLAVVGLGRLMSTFAFLGTQELIIVAVIALVLFGGNQIPKLARNLGKAQKELQKGLAEGQAEAEAEAEAGKEPKSGTDQA